MIVIEHKENCCGCGACMQTCPVQCIEMVPDPEGFIYPKVDNGKCINCQKCTRVCPVLGAHEARDSVQGTYISYNKDQQVRLDSSSGGVFSVLASQVIQDGGIVYGAALDRTFMAKHIRVRKLENLPLLYGSKYLQSRTESTYLRVREDLAAGKTVLYSGTPCQIAGLTQFLGRPYENLITVDILCHGTPSPLVWKDYLKFRFGNYTSNISKVSFRDKKYGWKNFSMAYHKHDGKVRFVSHREDLFMQLFLDNIILRPSCYDCRFKGLERPSDLTLGDAWGISKHLPDMDDDLGTSIILVHSQKGMDLVNKVSSKIVFCKAEVEKALPATADSRKSVSRHPRREQFFTLFSDDSRKAFRWFEKYMMLQRVRGSLRKMLKPGEHR